MLYRKIDDTIREHFSTSKSAIFLTGARQVGKTFAIRKYAKSARLHLLELNFLLQPETKDLFSSAGDVKELLLRFSAYSKEQLLKDRTLVFLDEIQECPDAVTWIKALVDEGSYLYAVSGSLLGVELRNVRSVPVGYMSEFRMFPMDFEEFCTAVGLPENVLAATRAAYETETPVDEYVHGKMMQLFRLYLVVGGMPAVVNTYVTTNNLRDVLREQQAVLAMYSKDITRYDPKNRLEINEIFRLVPTELNARNKRFILKNLNEHAAFSRHKDGFIWLKDADMTLPTYNVEEPKAPLTLSEQRSLFKLFQNDVGLLASQYADGIQLKIIKGDVDINFGAVFENAVAQELHAHGWELRYFNGKKTGELDFVLENDGEIIPIEVKSGKDYVRHRALANILDVQNYSIRKAIVFCCDNVSVSGKIRYLPVYMVMFVHRRTAPDDLIFKVSFDGL